MKPGAGYPTETKMSKAKKHNTGWAQTHQNRLNMCAAKFMLITHSTVSKQRLTTRM
jgi:nitrate reductase beta subunit